MAKKKETRKNQIDNAQAALLFHLMFFESKIPLLSKFTPKVSKPKAVQLEEMCLIKIERSGKNAREKNILRNIEVTDFAWEWFWDAENTVCPTGKASDCILMRLFEKIRSGKERSPEFLLKLTSLFEQNESMNDIDYDIEKEVTEAYLKASGGRFYELIAVSDIRSNMREELREKLPSALIAMQRAQKLVLNEQGNPAMLKKEDRENPVMVGGTPRHIVYIEGIK